MRAVVVAQSGTYGGAEAYLNRLYSGLSKEGVSPVLYGSLPGWDPLESHDLSFGPKWGKKTIARGLAHLRGERNALIRALRDESPDWIHCQFKREQIGFSRALSEIAPVVWTEHGRLGSGPQFDLLNRAYKKASRHVSRIICVSEEVADDVASLLGSRDKVLVIENAIDQSEVQVASTEQKLRARQVLGLSKEDRVLLWIGRLDSSKLPMLPVEVSVHWGSTVVVAGTGPLYEELARRARPLKNVHVLGHVKDIASLYHAADVVMFSSTGKSEGYPTTTMVETAAHGLPIVGNVSSGAGRVITQMGGRVVTNAHDPVEWSSELQRAIESHDREKTMKWAADHRVEGWLLAHEGLFELLRASGSTTD